MHDRGSRTACGAPTAAPPGAKTHRADSSLAAEAVPVPPRAGKPCRMNVVVPQPDAQMQVPVSGRRLGAAARRAAPEPQPVHFLHIGKTGGTAFKDAVLRAGQYRVKGADPVRAIHLHGHDTSLRDIPRGEKFFFFVRDPVSRFVSGFNSRRRWGRPRHFLPWTPAEAKAFRRFATADRLACALSSADSDEQTAAEAAMRDIRHVGSSYWKWFESETYFLSRLDDLFFIGFQQNLAANFEILKSKLGLPDGVSLPDDPVRSHRSPRNLDRTLGGTALANLHAWYRDDFRFVTLCEEVIREHPQLRSPDGDR